MNRFLPPGSWFRKGGCMPGGKAKANDSYVYQDGLRCTPVNELDAGGFTAVSKALVEAVDLASGVDYDAGEPYIGANVVVADNAPHLVTLRMTADKNTSQESSGGYYTII